MNHTAYTNKLFDLFFITDLKRVKPDESGFNKTRDKLINTTDYLEIVIADELHVKWDDNARNSRAFINRDFSNCFNIYIN